MLSYLFNGGIGATSHTPILTKMIFETQTSSHPILEVGAGFFSTPLIDQLLEGTGRKVLTLESVPEWVEFLSPLNNEYHSIIQIDNDDLTHILDYCSKQHWSIVFIDNHPDHLRHLFLDAVKNSADFIICHDTQEGHLFDIGWNSTLNEFKYRLDAKHLPWTTVVSNTHPIPIKNRWEDGHSFKYLQLP